MANTSRYEYQDRCVGCVFLRFDYDTDGMGCVPVCHAIDNRTKEERREATMKETCDICEEGYKLRKEKDELEEKGEKIPASKRYIYDKVEYSKDPVGFCGHITQGMEPCWDGEGEYCYSKSGCTSQMSLDDHNRRSTCQANLDFASVMKDVLGVDIE